MSKQMVLLRHGESTWNLANRFTGWTDVDLSEKGVAEAKASAKMIQDEGIEFDVVHVSLLRRSLMTMHYALDGLDRLWLPVQKHWRLNERHYGALTGLNKKETTEKHGEEQVFKWRRSYDIPPPPVDESSEYHPINDPRYRDIAPDLLPASECLADVVDRVLPYWYDNICRDLFAGKRVLVVAHGNSLRALVKHLDGISDDEIAQLNIPTGIPLLYELDDRLQATSHRYLGDPEAAKRAAEAVANQAKT